MHGRWSRAFARATMIGVILSHAVSVSVQAEEGPAKIWLDIPSQPLAEALIAFGAATGVEVFYDGALSVGRRSATVKGAFAPIDGLQALLRGTSYVPRRTAAAHGLTIAIPDKTASDEALQRHEPYFAVLQARLSDALCVLDRETGGDRQIIISFWLGHSGEISHATVLGLGDDPDRRDAISAAAMGARIGQPPPADLPQPVTMAIFPPAAGEPTGCRVLNRRAANK